MSESRVAKERESQIEFSFQLHSTKIINLIDLACFNFPSILAFFFRPFLWAAWATLWTKSEKTEGKKQWGQLAELFERNFSLEFHLFTLPIIYFSSLSLLNWENIHSLPVPTLFFFAYTLGSASTWKNGKNESPLSGVMSFRILLT